MALERFGTRALAIAAVLGVACLVVVVLAIASLSAGYTFLGLFLLALLVGGTVAGRRYYREGLSG